MFVMNLKKDNIMTIVEQLHDIFYHSKGFVPLSKLESITKNRLLIDSIGFKYNHRPVYKNKSNTMLGLGNHIYSDQWASSKKLDYPKE